MVLKEIKKKLVLSRNETEYVLFADEVFGAEESWLSEFELQYKKEVGMMNLEKLIASKTLRTAQGKAAKAHATKAFSVEKMISAHVSLYKKLSK
jgi:hypothetical protein